MGKIDNKKAIMQVLKKYSVAYPEFKLETKGAVLYADILSDFDAQKVDDAMHDLVKTCRFFPKIADIYGVIKEKQAAKVYQVGSPEWNAYQAEREKLLKEIRDNADKNTDDLECVRGEGIFGKYYRKT